MKPIYTALVLLMFLCPFTLMAQEVKIEIKKLESIDNKLVITYDFSNDVLGEMFDVWVEISTLSGRRINARTLKGDLGDNLSAGKNKQIIWDYVADDIVMDEEINIEVKALVSKQAEREIEKNTKGRDILLSAVFPGWGLSKMEKGKPYWIMGACTYLLAGSSLLLNNKAEKAYLDYSTDLNLQTSNDSFKKSKSYDKLSKVTAYSAIGVWAINIVWTLAKKPKKDGISISEKKMQRIQFYSHIDYRSKAACFTISYRF